MSIAEELENTYSSRPRYLSSKLPHIELKWKELYGFKLIIEGTQKRSGISHPECDWCNQLATHSWNDWLELLSNLQAIGIASYLKPSAQCKTKV